MYKINKNADPSFPPQKRMKKYSLKKPNRSHLLYKDERIESKEIQEQERVREDENNTEKDVGEEKDMDFCKYFKIISSV